MPSHTSKIVLGLALLLMAGLCIVVLAWVLVTRGPWHPGVASPDAGGPQVYRVYGQFLMDNEPDVVRDGLSRAVMQLRVERYEAVDQPGKPTSSAADKRYPELTWQVIQEGHQGVYGLSDTLKKRLNKRVRITGIVYNKCEGSLYLRRADDSEASCLFPDKPTHIELVDGKRHPLKVLPAR